MASSCDFLLIAGGRLITALVGIVAIRIATTFLTPAQYGELAMLIAVQAFCGLFLVNPVGQHISRHTHQWWDDGTLLARLASYGKYVLGVSAVGAVAVFVFVASPVAEETAFAVVAILFVVNAATWNATNVPMLNMLGFRASSVIWAIVTVSVALLASVALMNWIPNASAWMFGQALGMAVGAFGARRALQQRARKTVLSNGAHPLMDRTVILNYCLPLALATGLMWLQLSGYRFVVSAYWGLEMLGFLAVGLLIAGQIWALVETLTQQFLFPLFFRRISQANQNASQVALSDLLNLMGPVYLVLAGATFVAAPYILKLLAAPQYSGAEIFVRFGVCIECCRVLGNLFSQAAQVTKQTQSLAVPYAAGATLAIGLMLLAGSQSASVVWVGVILTIAAFVTVLFMGEAMFRQVAFALDWRRWLLGTLAMFLLALPAWWLVRSEDWSEALGAIAVIALVTGTIMLRMIWNNAALQRLLAINLRNLES